MAEQKQMYGENAFLVSILFGPLLVIFSLARNYKRMDRDGAMVATWAIGISLYLLLLIIFLFSNRADFLSIAQYSYGQYVLMINLITAFIGFLIYQSVQKPYFLSPEIQARPFGFLHVVGAGFIIYMTNLLLFLAAMYVLITYFPVQAQQVANVVEEANRVTVTKCFDEFSKYTEETDADHVRNMMKLKACASQDTSSDSLKLQGCVSNALKEFQIDPDGTMGNRKVVDAGFIRCLSE